MTNLLSRKGLQYAAELLVITVFALYAVRYYANFDPQMQYPGSEAEWVTFSAQWAAQSLREVGYIPRWQPYINRGQPTFDEGVGFILNPFSIVPSLLIGATNGLKVSILFYFIFAGTGGWFLGKVLGWSVLPRLLLGMLLILKGNMQSTVGSGYFQLGTVQAYFPWALAAALAIVRTPERRWTPIMLALVLALVLFAGNLYYILPVLIMVGLVFLCCGFQVRLQPFAVRRDRAVWRRILQAGIFAFGLSAVYLLPVLGYHNLIGRHPNYIFRGDPTDIGQVLGQFFVPHLLFPHGTWWFNYYTYVVPFWYLILVFVVAPFVVCFGLRGKLRVRNVYIWILGFSAFVVFTQWSIEPNPLMLWLYEHVPFIGQWRVPNRMLALSALFVAFLVAHRLNGLIETINAASLGQSRIRVVLSIALIVASFIAVFEVTNTRHQFNYLERKPQTLDTCLDWLRAVAPEKPLAVWAQNNYLVWTFIRHDIRMANVTGDLDQLGVTPTLYPHDLTSAIPEFIIPLRQEEISHWEARDYQVLPDSPLYVDQYPCLMRNPNALSYAFTISLDDLSNAPSPLPLGLTTPVPIILRQPERVSLWVTPQPDTQLVVVAQEVAYPGWSVRVNSSSAQLESVGQLIGVVVPAGETPQVVEFVYNGSPLLHTGGTITLLTALSAILYLLRADKILYSFRRRTRAFTAHS
jgi:hypothetical protein